MPVLFGALLVLGACTEVELVSHGAKQLSQTSPSDELGQYKVGDPYQVGGVWYYPAVDMSYDESGIASWYGPNFHGKRTANGALFDENKVSAAHKTLPLPTLARVTNLENGRSIKVLINDRGPFAHGRVIDLSRRAAQLLDFERKGTARVRVQVLEAESRQVALAAQNGTSYDGGTAPEPAPTVAVAVEEEATESEEAPKLSDSGTIEVTADRQLAEASLDEEVVTQTPVQPTNIFVQAGAFSVYNNANKLRARLNPLGPVQLTPAQVNGQQFFRVRVGPMDSVDEADQMLATLIDNGYTESRIVIE